MKKVIAAGVLLVSVFVAPIANADPFVDGVYAAERGDHATALKLWTPLAQQGDRLAQYNLALMYQKGKGVPQNYSEAFKWYKLSAHKGFAKAQYNLALMYQEGKGVPQNYSEAFKWYRLAAQQGFASAQSNLGALYGMGRGVPQNAVKAHMWINLAASVASDDDKISLVARDAVAKFMTPAQIAEAQALAAKCQASNYKNCD